MFALTGWIPEQYRTDDDDFKPARLWERLCSASKYGDCLITVATGEMDEAEEKKWGLVPTHAYAVLQVREVGGVKQSRDTTSHVPTSQCRCARWAG